MGPPTRPAHIHASTPLIPTAILTPVISERPPPTAPHNLPLGHSHRTWSLERNGRSGRRYSRRAPGPGWRFDGTAGPRCRGAGRGRHCGRPGVGASGVVWRERFGRSFPGCHPGGPLKAIESSLTKHGAKSDQACVIPQTDRDAQLPFDDFPADLWRHLRTTNPTDSTFATIRLSQRRSKRTRTRQASLAMMSHLAQSAPKQWRKLNAPTLILSLLEGKVFTDGVLQHTHAA
jgi:hypothetical protein